jgi:cytochrome c oxidase subunit IV
MDWLDDPAILAGVPLLALGVIGAFIALAASFAPERPMALEQGAAVRARAHAGTGAHPTPSEYVNIGLILGAITAIEVIVYYIDALSGALVPILLVLSATKFALVVLWFMHLRFDNALFSTLFTGGLMLVAAIFIVVLATLGASLR